MMTVRQAAERLAVSPQTVYKLCDMRMIAHERIGAGRGTIRISDEALEAYRKSCLVGVAAEEPVLPPPPIRTRLKRLGI